jgi:lipopolysaccharide exporter
VPGEGPPLATAGSVDPSDLRAASLSGARWVSLARLIAETLAVGSSVVLARLIPPAEFGRAAIALGFVAVALGIAWVGFGTPLIQMRSIEKEDIEVATLMSVATGVALTIASILLLAPFVVEPIFGGRVAYLLKLGSPVFFLSGISAVPTALLQRRLAFRRLSQIEILSVAAGPTAAIVLAAAVGLDGEALVLGGVATAFVGTVLTLLVSRLQAPRWRRREAARVASFGAFAALAAVTGTMFSNIDYVILGARLPAREVGLYWRGYQLGVEYQSKISGIMLRLALPLYSRAASLDEMRRLRSKMVRVNTIVLFPVLTTLIALAPELVPLVFGPAWEGAVFPTQILAIAGMGSVATVGSASVAFAVGKPRAVFYFFLLLLGGYVIVVTWASAYGLRTVVIAVAIYQVVLVAGQFYFLESRQAGIPLREIWAAILPAFVSSGISLAAAYPVARALAETGLADVFVILAAGTLAVAVYALALRVLFPASWRELIDLAREFVGRGKRGQDDALGEITPTGE